MCVLPLTTSCHRWLDLFALPSITSALVNSRWSCRQAGFSPQLEAAALSWASERSVILSWMKRTGESGLGCISKKEFAPQRQFKYLKTVRGTRVCLCNRSSASKQIHVQEVQEEGPQGKLLSQPRQLHRRPVVLHHWPAATPQTPGVWHTAVFSG